MLSRSEGTAKNLNACQREMLRLRLSMTGAGGVSSPMSGAPARCGGAQHDGQVYITDELSFQWEATIDEAELI